MTKPINAAAKMRKRMIRRISTSEIMLTVTRRPPRVSGASAAGVSHHVNGGRHGEDQGFVLPLSNLYPVGVCYAEPLLGHLGYLVSPLADGVLVIEDIALYLE